ncbi:purine nucleoside phosphorylase-like isoform X2 [Tigriopus californicus]|uniref:purine nucleoside phosphorylase-like isoform X2 n=1 Tax=Tigriopus californicus TaxID=6832 RepID=UPI0027DA8E29|nr:purine nucleoside phosphorylase-like isoform X2 [Tigriopus californicus]
MSNFMGFALGPFGGDEETDDNLAYNKVKASSDFLMNNTKYRPKIAVICGSGLADLANLLEQPDIFEYNNIPNFPTSTVPGHKSRMLFGTLNGIQVMLMQGRFHAYEGYSLSKVAMPVRVMKLCGIKKLIVTNAAGGLNPNFKVGDVMIIKDHINLPGFTGVHPLRGPNDPRFGSRFFAVNDCYMKRIRDQASEVVMEQKLEKCFHEGVYAMLGGPNFETVAELKMLRICGVDAVGMSTIPEVLVAHHCGIAVFGFSLITNECIVEEDSNLFANHEEVIEAANSRKDLLSKFVSEIIKRMDAMDLKNDQVKA